MKKGLKAAILMLATAGMLSACKGGTTGEKMDSTMVDKNRMDSTAQLNKKAGTMSADTSSTPRDSMQTDTGKK